MSTSQKENGTVGLLGDYVRSARLDNAEESSASGFDSLKRFLGRTLNKLDFRSTMDSGDRSRLRPHSSMQDISKSPMEGKGESQHLMSANRTPISARAAIFWPTATKGTPDIEKSQTEACTFSFEEEKIVSRTTSRRSPYPRGVNPLGCHPDVMLFASGTSEGKELGEGEQQDPDELQDAPIYDPSRGEINQYSKTMPLGSQPVSSKRATSSKHQGRELKVQFDIPSSEKSPEECIPQHESPRAQKGVKKSFSSIGLFQRAWNKDTNTPLSGERESKKDKYNQLTSPHVASKVGTRDPKQKTSEEGKGVRKSRSRMFGFSRKSMSPESTEVSVPSYQPNTPSPLQDGGVTE